MGIYQGHCRKVQSMEFGAVMQMLVICPVKTVATGHRAQRALEI